MATRYDSSIIQQFADRLYRQAAKMVFFYGLFGLILGGGGGALLGLSIPGQGPLMPGVVFAIAGWVLGAALGRERAFALRLHAQTALCQAQIERNTRRLTSDDS